MIKYRFEIQVGSITQDVFPIYKSDLSKDYELESNERFYRVKLSGKLTFLKADFDFIMAQPFDSIYIVKCYQSKDAGISYKEYCAGKFARTDCEIDYDNKILTVSTDTYDQYNDVLAGIENEYNLIELAPEIERLTIKKRPMIQIYVAGDSVISNVIGGVYWEQDVINATSDDNTLVNKYFFSKASVKKRFLITAQEGDFVGKGCEGEYIGTKELLVNTNQIKLIYYEKSYPIPDGGAGTRLENGYYLGSSSELFYYQFSQYRDSFQGDPNPGEYLPIPSSFALNPSSLNPSAIPVNATNSDVNIYMRYLTNSLKIGDLDTYPLPTDDIIDYNRNYRRAIGFNFDLFYTSMQVTNTPTEWGRANNGNYFVRPSNYYFPIARSTWGDWSFWFNSGSVYTEIFEEDGTAEFELKDSYPVSSVISVLLKKISPNITHEATEEYSQFLYSQTNPISMRAFTLLVTPKSNILNGEYQTPALKANTTLRQFLDMLKNAFQCYWFIEDNKLKIEHIKWFKNGGSYNNIEIGVDITQLINVRNNKSWGFATNKVKFEKSQLPERYEFAWMDETTKGFDGFPIEVNSNFVQKGRKEDTTIANFTSDIDYMLLNPGSISDDGFCLFAAVMENQKYVLPINTLYTAKNEFKLQNYIASLVFLLPNFYGYNLPSEDVTINEEYFLSKGIIRGQMQTLNFPYTQDFDVYKLVKTDIGNAEVKKISINLSSQMINAQLAYDTNL